MGRAWGSSKDCDASSGFLQHVLQPQACLFSAETFVAISLLQCQVYLGHNMLSENKFRRVKLQALEPLPNCFDLLL